MKVTRSEMMKINVGIRLQVQIPTNLQKAFVPLLDSPQIFNKTNNILSTYKPITHFVRHKRNKEKIKRIKMTIKRVPQNL